MKVENKAPSVVFFPMKTSKGEYKTICGLPVFTFANVKTGKPIKSKALTCYDVNGVQKEMPVKADLRLIPKLPKYEKIFKNPGLTCIEVSIAGARYYMVPFVSPQFIGGGNFKLARQWIAESLLTTPSNSLGETHTLPLNLLTALCDEMKTPIKVKRASCMIAYEAILSVTGWNTMNHYQGISISMVEYISTMKSILSVVLKVSDKKLSLAEYKICKGLVKKNTRVVKKTKRMMVK